MKIVAQEEDATYVHGAYKKHLERTVVSGFRTDLNSEHDFDSYRILEEGLQTQGRNHIHLLESDRRLDGKYDGAVVASAPISVAVFLELQRVHLC